MSEKVALAPGTRVADFLVKSVAEVHANCIIYHAQDSSLASMPVILKEFFPSRLAHRQAKTIQIVRLHERVEAFNEEQSRFVREADRLAKVSHPGIIRILRYFEANGTSYQALEWIDGPNCLDSNTRWSQAKIVSWMLDLAGALNVLHATGLVLCSLNPSSVSSRRKSGRPVITSIADSVGMNDALCGINDVSDNGFVAPECLRQPPSDLGPWSDVYSLGALLYYLSCGQEPPTATQRLSRGEIDEDVLRLSIQRCNPSLPEDFVALIENMLSLAIGSRPALGAIAKWPLSGGTSQPIGSYSRNHTEYFNPTRAEDPIGGIPAVDDVVGGRFRIDSEIGEGGFGALFLATDLVDVQTGTDPEKAQRVLKFPRTQVAADERAATHLRAEAHHAMQLLHPNIVRVHDFHVDRGRLFVSMEYIRGYTLSDILQDATPARKTKWIQQLFNAFSFAHSQNIVHADIKANNVLIDQRDDVRVLDFGLARSLAGDAIGPQRRLAGFSRGYSSCDVMSGREPLCHDDVFSLGCLIYLIYAGELPFGRDATGAPIDAIQARESGLVPARPKALGRIKWAALRKALTHRTDQRFASIPDFQKAWFAKDWAVILSISSAIGLAAAIVTNAIYEDVAGWIFVRAMDQASLAEYRSALQDASELKDAQFAETRSVAFLRASVMNPHDSNSLDGLIAGLKDISIRDGRDQAIAVAKALIELIQNDYSDRPGTPRTRARIERWLEGEGQSIEAKDRIDRVGM